MNHFAAYLPFSPAAPRVSVGAYPAAGDQAAVEQRRAFADEALKNADKAFSVSMQAHSGYESAFAFNAAATEQADKLRVLTELILATGGDLTAEESEFVAAQRDFAKTLLTSLALRKSQLETDEAKHKPPIFVLPPGYFNPPPPVFVPPGPPEEPTTDEPPAEPPASGGGSPLLWIAIGATLLYVVGPLIAARLLSKKGY